MCQDCLGEKKKSNWNKLQVRKIRLELSQKSSEILGMNWQNYVYPKTANLFCEGFIMCNSGLGRWMASHQCSLPPFPSCSKCWAWWSGTYLGSVGVICSSCVPSQIPVHPCPFGAPSQTQHTSPSGPGVTWCKQSLEWVRLAGLQGSLPAQSIIPCWYHTEQCLLWESDPSGLL